ncbi:hypothetical protein PHET_07233 [Paragonimus heterotremus]|uniref:Uncharacterized protein n=1 Tax=Paragonimus heterotremus TaxID=100268 RepID=A0A8J4SXM4_9TREM|nr:hypothetical protein PHET_07233 [Paragonimus heterotremus]
MPLDYLTKKSDVKRKDELRRKSRRFNNRKSLAMLDIELDGKDFTDSVETNNEDHSRSPIQTRLRSAKSGGGTKSVKLVATLAPTLSKRRAAHVNLVDVKMLPTHSTTESSVQNTLDSHVVIGCGPRDELPESVEPPILPGQSTAGNEGTNPVGYRAYCNLL